MPRVEQGETARAERRAGTGKATLLDYGRGLLMGTADMVPGVSGGTVALVVGIYERLVRSVRSVTAAPLWLVRGDRAAARERAAEVEWRLVVPVVLGIGTAIVAGSGILPRLLDEHPLETSSLFFGLILGSLVVPFRLIDDVGRRELALAAVAAVAAFVLVGLPDRELADPSLLLVFGAAAVAICAMVLPGISGAYLLLLIGVYKATLEAVHERDLVYVLVFGAGAFTGLTAFARLLGRLLDRHHSPTMAVLFGLMAGSLRALWPWADVDRRLLPPPADAGEIAVALLFAAAGFALVTAVIAVASRRHSD
jgi:putative membrane protein